MTTLQFDNQTDFTTPSKLRAKHHILVDNTPYQVLTCSPPIVTSKHGSAKYIFKLLALGSNKKKSIFFHADDKVSIPVLTRQDYSLLDIEDGHMSLLSEDDRLLEGVPIAKNNLGEVILSKFNASEQLIINIKGFDKYYDITGYKIDNTI